ncbi:MAG: nucleoside 2-deoxyribosyltransferase [Alphaproteobacteria bacterium]|jgi:nucleoside 2-deoxyribosyltransferase
MPYELITSGEMISSSNRYPNVYLGGNCQGRDWRLDFFRRFTEADVKFINPSRTDFPNPEIAPGEHARQVAWERQALAACDIAVFWLGAGLNNQATRVEIGFAMGQGKVVLIGAEDGFLGGEHLTAFSGLVISSSIEGIMNRFSSWYTQHLEGRS